MSPLPERRKSPEELAALREALGVPPDQAIASPSPPREDKLPTTESSIFEPSEKLIQPSTKAKPVRSLRKSRGLSVDQPKEKTAKNDGTLPVRRHRQSELVGLKEKEPLPVIEPATYLQSLQANRRWLVLFYSAGLGTVAFAIGWVMFGENQAGESVSQNAASFPSYWLPISALLGGVAVMLLGAGWLKWRRPRSEHHAGILTIIAVLVIAFGIVYFFPRVYGP